MKWLVIVTIIIGFFSVPTGVLRDIYSFYDNSHTKYLSSEESTPFRVERFSVQHGTPIGIRNFTNPQDNCEWMTVGGQVFGEDERPISGLLVQVKGDIEGNEIAKFAFTGGSMSFGEGGYEINLTEHIISTRNSITIQLKDVNGLPLSPKIDFDTYGECKKSLVMINFIELDDVFFNFAPLMHKQ